MAVAQPTEPILGALFQYEMIFERQSNGNQPEYSLQMRRCSECFLQQRSGSQVSVTAVKTVSQHKEILSAAAFCMHILEANMHLSKLEKSNLQ